MIKHRRRHHHLKYVTRTVILKPTSKKMFLSRQHNLKLVRLAPFEMRPFPVDFSLTNCSIKASYDVEDFDR